MGAKILGIPIWLILLGIGLWLLFKKGSAQTVLAGSETVDVLSSSPTKATGTVFSKSKIKNTFLDSGM